MTAQKGRCVALAIAATALATVPAAAQFAPPPRDGADQDRARRLHHAASVRVEQRDLRGDSGRRGGVRRRHPHCRPDHGGDPQDHRQEGPLRRDLASLRRPRHRRLALPRGQADRDRLAQADARPLPTGARRNFWSGAARPPRNSPPTRATSWSDPNLASTAR